MPLCLFEDDHVPHLRPLVNTRPAYALRLGIRTLRATAEDAFQDLLPDASTTLHTRSLLHDVTAEVNETPVNAAPTDGTLFLNGRYVARDGPVLDRLQRAVREQEAAGRFVQDEVLVAAWVPGAGDTLPADVLDADALTPETFGTLPAEEVTGATLVRHPWDLLSTLRPALHRDFTARTGRYNILEDIYERRDTTVHPSAIGVNPEQIYLAPGATIQPGAVLNAADGPIYVGRGATVHEQAVVRGPLYLGPKAQVKGGANVEGSAIGYWSKVGGEVHDSVIQSLSNKSHAGFLGHAYLGRWCNLGADTNNSNLKNDYGDVAAYDVAAGETVSTGRQFAGLFMGDHSKCGINTMFNTGTVVGTFCNIYGGDFPPRYVPSFSWGTPRDGFADYRLDKALEVADAVMQRRERRLTDAQRALLTELFDATAAERARMHG